MDITKLTDNSNVLALLSGEKEIYQFSEKDQKEVISILNESPPLMMEYLNIVALDDDQLCELSDLEDLLTPKLKANLEVLEHAITIDPRWLDSFNNSIILDKHILSSLAHEDIFYISDADRIFEMVQSSHISTKFIFEILKLSNIDSINKICMIISNLKLSHSDVTDEAIVSLLVEFRINIEEHTKLGKNSIFYEDLGYFHHWTERVGGVNIFESFVKAITAKNSKKIMSELVLLKNCFEEYFKMLKKENIEFHVEEPIQAWIDAFE